MHDLLYRFCFLIYIKLTFHDCLHFIGFPLSEASIRFICQLHVFCNLSLYFRLFHCSFYGLQFFILAHLYLLIFLFSWEDIKNYDDTQKRFGYFLYISIYQTSPEKRIVRIVYYSFCVFKNRFCIIP